MAPAIDSFLHSLAAKREFRGSALDLYCTAIVSAEWTGLANLDEGEDEQAALCTRRHPARGRR